MRAAAPCPIYPAQFADLVAFLLLQPIWVMVT